MSYERPDNLPPPPDDDRELRGAYEGLREQLARTEAEIARISSLLSHDLRAQLRSIDAFREFLLEDAGDQLDAEAREYLTRIGRAAHDIDHLVHQVVRLQRLPRQPLRLETAPLAEILGPALRRFREAFPDTPLQWARGEVLASRPVRADAARLSEAVYQLLDNAARFVTATEDEPPPVELALERAGDDRLLLRVIDHGVGIHAADEDRIFELGVRLHGPRTFRGAGVGLYLVRRLLEGWAWGPALVDSEPGRGSTFEIGIPTA